MALPVNGENFTGTETADNRVDVAVGRGLALHLDPLDWCNRNGDTD
jgi:hypothetical protein